MMDSFENKLSSTLVLDTSDETLLTLSESEVTVYDEFILIFMIIFCSVGFIGNILNLTVFIRMGKHLAIHVFIKSSIICEILIISIQFVNAFYVTNYQISLRQIYTVTCILALLLEYILDSLLGSCSLITLLVTIERFIAVCYPFKSKYFDKPKLATFIVIIICLSSFIYHCPLVIAPVNITLSNQTDLYLVNKKYDFFSNYKIYKSIREVLFRGFPAALITLLNTSTIMEYKQVSVQRHIIISYPPCNVLDKEEQSLLITLTVITFSWLASAIAGISLTIHELFQEWSKSFLTVVMFIEIISFGCTFLLHFAFNRKFRQIFITIFFKKETEQPPRTQRQSNVSSISVLITTES